MKKINWKKIIVVEESLFSIFAEANSKLLTDKILRLNLHLTTTKYINNTIYHDSSELLRIDEIITANPERIIPFIYKRIEQYSNKFIDVTGKLQKIK